MDTPRKVPTKEQWAALEQKLAGFMGSARLRVDGFDLELHTHRVFSLKQYVVVYVDGHKRGAWSFKQEDGNFHEVAIRFYAPRSKFLWGKKERSKVARAMGKAAANERFEWRDPDWTSIPALRRHLLANNHHIEILE